MNHHNLNLMLFLALAGLSAQSAWALASDRNQPITIEADQGTLDQKNQVTTFSGNVVMAQGTLNIRAGKVTAKKDHSGNQSVDATGSPVTFSQQMDDGQTVRGQADHVQYTSSTGVVTLSGNARVERGGDRARGALISYNMRTAVYSVSGVKGAKGASRRISIILQPSHTSGKK